MFFNPSLDDIKIILQNVKHIVVVGLSPKPRRPSHQVASALQSFGYHIIPVRPAVDEVLGEKAYADLGEVPDPIDMVDVFRAPDKISPIVDVCIERKIPVLWLQDGVINEAEALRAQAAGITVIMNRCTYRDYMSLLRDD
ncbi:MAG: CoA-binding protein [Thioalkalispiraceae bacterium]|jgi:predicted CoA-binding protein